MDDELWTIIRYLVVFVLIGGLVIGAITTMSAGGPGFMIGAAVLLGLGIGVFKKN